MIAETRARAGFHGAKLSTRDRSPRKHPARFATRSPSRGDRDPPCLFSPQCRAEAHWQHYRPARKIGSTLRATGVYSGPRANCPSTRSAQRARENSPNIRSGPVGGLRCYSRLYRRRCAAQPRVGEPAARDQLRLSGCGARKRDAVSRATRGSLSTTPSCPARSWRNKRANARVTPPGVAGTENCPPLARHDGGGQQGTGLRCAAPLLRSAQIW